MLPGMELMGCQNLAVPADVMHHVVRVESSFNPYAIGVVGGRLARQPANLPEALATVRMLEGRGYNFSLGLAQVNRYNLAKYGLGSYEQAFQACPNLQAGSRILAECHGRSGGDWGKSFSCYYSGNFTTGFRHGYVQKVYASMRSTLPTEPGAIPVSGNPGRRAARIVRYPARAAYDGTPPSRAVTIAASPVEPPKQPEAPPSTGSASDTANELVVLQANGRAPLVAPNQVEKLAPAAEPTPAARPSDAAFVF
ncbi:MAG TPA: lytic transglycosylase domain-containing protein [Lysobacter sp.]|nr:lytic transglycosylase domain-containing protein [Lysobacter sp.]